MNFKYYIIFFHLIELNYQHRKNFAIIIFIQFLLSRSILYPNPLQDIIIKIKKKY